MTEYETFYPLFEIETLMKFTSVLPPRKGLFCYFNESPVSIHGTVYISNHQQKLTGGRQLDPEHTVGYVEIMLDKKEQIVSIPWVSVSKQFRGNGIGKYLLILSAELARTYGAKTMELDDHSDNAWSRNNNMYINLGLEYTGAPPDPPNSGEPEMKGNTDVIAGKWKTYRQEYICRPFFNS